MVSLINRIRSLLANISSSTQTPNDAFGEFFLWDDIAPGSDKQHTREKISFNGKFRLISNIHRPSITAFIPRKEIATGTALIIAPGGGHSDLWIDHEGYNPARWFCEKGIASFVLKYRLARDTDSMYSVKEHALADMQRAIRLVRSRVEEWGIKKDAIGVMGFSAGGELAGLAAMHHAHEKENLVDEIDKQDADPNFQALIYPADTNQFEVFENSPPAFMLAGSLDSAIARDISNLYLKYKEAGILAKLIIYENVDHGFGVQTSNKDAVAEWPMKFYEWLVETGFIKK